MLQAYDDRPDGQLDIVEFSNLIAGLGFVSGSKASSPATQTGKATSPSAAEAFASHRFSPAKTLRRAVTTNIAKSQLGEGRPGEGRHRSATCEERSEASPGTASGERAQRAVPSGAHSNLGLL